MSARVVLCRSNPVAPDPRVEKAARALHAAGYAVQIVAWDRTASLPTPEVRPEFVIHRLALPAGFGRGWRNLGPLLRWQWRLGRWLWTHRRSFDIIHACDFDTIWPALWCRWWCRKRVVYDIFDFYADHARLPAAWLRAVMRRLEWWAAARADGVILVDEVRRAQLGPTRLRHWTVVYNTPEDQKARLTFEPSPAGRLRLAYVGLLQAGRGLETVLTVLRRHPEWHLDLAGFGADAAHWQALAQALPNVTWHGRVSYDTALALNARADVLLALYDPSVPNHRYASPNKLFEAMMLGKPVLVAAGTHIDEVVQRWQCGLVVPYGQPQALEQALALLASQPELRRRLGQHARRAYEEHFGWAQMAQRLRALYQAIETA